MKKILSIAAIFIVVFSMFLTFIPQLNAERTAFQLKELWRVPIVDNIRFTADVGDVDGDGLLDIAIVPDDPPYYYTLQVIRNDGIQLWAKTVFVGHGYVALSDIDTDGKCEVLVLGYLPTEPHATIYAFDDDGTLLWQFKSSDHLRYSTIAFAQLDVDSEFEILVSGVGSSGTTVNALDSNGAFMWRFDTSYWIGYGSPAVMDMDGDDEEEIIMFTFGGVYILNKQGGLERKILDVGFYTPLGVVGDVTGDGVADIAVSYAGVSTITADPLHNTLYVAKGDGTVVWSKSYAKTSKDFCYLPILVDINGDSIKDIVVQGNGTINAYRNDGLPLWTFGTFTDEIWALLGHLDINHDGKDEILTNPRSTDYLLALSTDGQLIFNLTLPNNGRWWGNDHGHCRGTKEFYIWGDFNKNELPDLPIHEVINDQIYIAIVEITPSVITATIDIDPDTLNLKSNGEFVTVYIELPEGYNVSDIDLSTVQLDGIPAITDPQYGFVTDPTSYLMDHDGDGIPERMLKFDRATVRDALTGMIDYVEGIKFYELTLTVTGEVAGTPFEGSDTIVVIKK